MTQSAEFTKSMRKTHTIYMPDMIHYHNDLLCAAFKYGGYNLDIVPEYDHLARRVPSLINKDYCTCATYIVGNLLTFVEEKGCETDNIAFLEPQAGGACRAGNYYNLIIECLKKTGNSNIPVLSLNAHGLEGHSGFKINTRMLFAAVAAVAYSDLLMTLTQQIKPYEINKGETVLLREKWIKKLSEEIACGKLLFHREAVYKQIIADFKAIETNRNIVKKKVGIVGEIYIKFSPIGNRHLEDFLEKNNCDYRHGGFINYCCYVVYTEKKCMELEGKGKPVLAVYDKILDYIFKVQKEINDCLEEEQFLHDGLFTELKRSANDIISDEYNIGDGWLIAAEAIDLINQGYDKILMVHPFGCLVSHVGERGILKKFHEMYPHVSIQSIEYDVEQSEALRESRILMTIN